MEARGGERWVPFAGEGAELAGGALAGAKAPRQAGGGACWEGAGVRVTVVSCGGDVEGSVSGRAGWTLGPRVEASTVVRTRDKADEGAGCRGVAGTRLCGSS